MRTCWRAGTKRRLMLAMSFIMALQVGGRAVQPDIVSAAPPVLDPSPVRTIGGPGHAEFYGWGVTTATDGTILATDYWNKRVVRLATDGTLIETVVDNVGYSTDNHQTMYGITVDPATGDIWVADTDRAEVDHYTADGTYVGKIGTRGSGTDQFRYPSRIAVHPVDGRIYVADTWAHTISVHDPATGAELFAFGEEAGDATKPRAPRGMAFDDQNRLYVVSHGLKRVEIYADDGTFVSAFGDSGPGQLEGDIRGLDIDLNLGVVYVADGVAHGIKAFALDGTFLSQFGSFGSAPGEFLNGGREITVDDDGNIWVGDLAGFRLQKFAPDGTSLLTYPAADSPPPDGGFNAPQGVAVDSAGNVFVVDIYNQRIQKFDAAGNHVVSWGRRGNGAANEFNYPRMIAIDPRNDEVVVVDTDNFEVERYANDGTFISAFGKFGTAPGEFANPQGVDVGPDGRIYIADSNNDRVQIFEADGTPVSVFGTSGSGDGEFEFPRGIAVGPDGLVYVADSNRNDIQVFDVAGTHIRTVGFGQLQRPFDLEVDDTYIYVADTQAHEITVLTLDGKHALDFGHRGPDLGESERPRGLDLSADGLTLYVAEMDNERVTVWDLTGADGQGQGPAASQFIGGPGHSASYPNSLTAMPDGGIVLADTGNSLLTRYDAAGEVLWSTGGRDGDFVTQLLNPRDVSHDPASDWLYVADTAHSRIAVYAASDGDYLFEFRGPDGDRIGSPLGLDAIPGYVVVSDASKNRMTIFTSNGGFVAHKVSSGACQFEFPRDVVVGDDYSMYVANYTGNDIIKMQMWTGNCQQVWGGTKGTAPGEFQNPYGIDLEVVPGGDDLVYVADSNNNRIQVFDTDGVWQDMFGTTAEFTALRNVAVSVDGSGVIWGSDLWGSGAKGWTDTGAGWTVDREIAYGPRPLTDDAVFNQVRGLDWDAAGTLHAIDTVNQRYVRFDSDGSVLDACGERGFVELGQFNWPEDLAIDPVTGEIWVTDTKQNRIQIMAPGCTGVERFGDASEFDWPQGIAFRATDRTVWVADTRNDRIKVYDADSRAELAVFDGAASAIGTLNDPRGISIDPISGDIIIADTLNDRVVQLQTVGVTVTDSAVVATGLDDPEAAVRDGVQSLFVADTGADVVRVYDRFGDPVRVLAGFDEPSDLGISPDGELFVADTYNDTIKVFPSFSTSPPILTEGTLLAPAVADAYPTDIAVNWQRIFVLDSGGASIKVIDRPSGQVTHEYGGIVADGEPALGAARALAAADGRLYVADTARNEVLVFDYSLNLLDRWGMRGSGDGEFILPYGIEIGERAPGVTTIFVTDDGGERIQLFDPDGTYVTTYGSTGQFNTIRDLVYNTSNDALYVVSARDREIVVLDAATGFELDRFGAEGDGPGEFTGDPSGIAIDSAGDIYVTNTRGGEVHRFRSDGTFVETLASGDLNEPRGIYVTNDGVLFVADLWDYAVKRFRVSDGALLGQTFGTPAGDGVNRPRGIAYDASNDRLLVTDWWNQRIVGVQSTGANVTTFGFRDTNDSLGSLNFPYDVAVQPGTDRVFVANREAHRIEVFEADGTFVMRNGTRGAGAGQFEFPSGLAFDPSGALWVADSENDRLQQFAVAADGSLGHLATLGQSGNRQDGPGFFNYPADLAFEADGTLWVTDAFNNSVQRRATDGTWTRITATDGFPLSDPRGVHVSATGEIYIADAGNDRLVVLAADQTLIGEYRGAEFGVGALSYPYDVTTNGAGQIYVSDFDPSRVLVTSRAPVVQQPVPGPDGTIDSPVEDELVVSQGAVTLAGTASAGHGVQRVLVTIVDRNTNEWYRSDGTWGAWQSHEVQMAEAVGATETDWTFTFDPDRTADLTVRLVVWDMLNEQDPTKATRRFSYELDQPNATPDVTITSPLETEVMAGSVTVTGVATDDVEVTRVRLAIQNQDTKQWLQADGSWGSFARHEATLDSPGSAATGFTYTFTPAAQARIWIQAKADDGTVESLPATTSASFDPSPSAPRYLTVIMARSEWQQVEACAQLPGAVTLDRVAQELAARGVTATGSVVTQEVAQSTRTCDPGGYENASWDDLADLRDTYGWNFISHSRNYPNLTTLTPAEQYDEVCGSLDDLAAQGHNDAWGLFAYPNNKRTEAIQNDIVETCFAFGRKYASAVNPMASLSDPWYVDVRGIGGGACVDEALTCSTIDANGRTYIDPAAVRAIVTPATGEWRVAQFFRFVEGSRLTGDVQWDCTSPDWRQHWTNRAEMYCFDDFLSAFDDLPADVTVVSPAQVATEIGRIPTP